MHRLLSPLRCAWSLADGPAERIALLWRLSKNLRVRLGLAAHDHSIYQIRTIYGVFALRENFGDVTNLVSLVHPNVYRARPLDGDGVILDVGANIGLAAALFHHFEPHREIHCFEPLPLAAELIHRNCPAARVHVTAVGAGPGEISLAVDDGEVMASTIATKWSTRPRVLPVQSLDHLTREHAIGDVALLKIDTEGMELDVLRGAEETLRRVRRVTLETHGRERHRSVIEALAEHGFEIRDASFEHDTGMVFASRPDHDAGENPTA